MNEIQSLESLGFALPSPAYIAGAILFGLIGWLAFRRGRKTATPLLTWTGVALMRYPYALSQTWLLWLSGIALSGLAFAIWK